MSFTVARSCFQDFITAHNISNTHITRESPTNATETIEFLRSERQQLIAQSKDQSEKLLEWCRFLGQKIDQSNETIESLCSERQQLISNSKDQSKMLLDLGARLKRELSYTVNIVKFMNLLAIWFGFFLGLGLVFVYCVYYRLFPFSWCMQ
jgi:hypothetical protein